MSKPDGQRQRPRLAVVKFASCDGCQLSILNLEEDLLAIGQALDLAYFPEASKFYHITADLSKVKDIDVASTLGGAVAATPNRAVSTERSATTTPTATTASSATVRRSV